MNLIEMNDYNRKIINDSMIINDYSNDQELEKDLKNYLIKKDYIYLNNNEMNFFDGLKIISNFESNDLNLLSDIEIFFIIK